MSTFVDTSALLAVLDADDAQHARAARAWNDLLEGDEPLVTSNYVLVEVAALAQARLGLDAVRALDADVVPALAIVWVDESRHRAAMRAVLTARRRGLSLVDCVSFDTMRQAGSTRVFAFDRHFRQQGFDVIP